MGQKAKTRVHDDDDDEVPMLARVILVVLLCGGFVWLLVSLIPPPRHPEYMVCIAGVDGLNVQAASGVPTRLSPVFNLTVRIDSSAITTWETACVWGLSTAAVSYGDAFLARGSVPPFCAEEGEVQERAATAWGQDVVLPRFLRERLSAELERGEASLDVQVTMPTEACASCSDKVLVCSKVKIGGSAPSPCRVQWMRPMPAAGSTPTS